MFVSAMIAQRGPGVFARVDCVLGFASKMVVKHQGGFRMVAYIVFTRERVRDPAELEVYSTKAASSVAGHPVKPLAIYGKSETLEGAPIDSAVIMEFPTLAAAKAWYDSPGYTEARQHRFKGADYRVFIVEGL
jgi:uncharacterized protein (DUF1330 family)